MSEWSGGGCGHPAETAFGQKPSFVTLDSSRLKNFPCAMLKINEIDIVVASREMELHFEDGRTETFLVKVGMPYEYGNGFDWCCPYEIGTESNRSLRGAFGIDSIQALELAMKIIILEIKIWEKFQVDENDPKT